MDSNTRVVAVEALISVLLRFPMRESRRGARAPQPTGGGGGQASFLAMDPVIAKGTCFPMFAYEVAQSIDLDAAQRRLVSGVERQTIKYKRRAPASFEYRPAPVHVPRSGEPQTGD